MVTRRSILLLQRAAFVLVVTALCALPVMAEEEIRIDRITTRVTYVREGEKVTRASGSAGGSDTSVHGVDHVAVEVDDSILVQVACVNETGKPAHPQQAFVRFVRLDEETVDSVHVMIKKPVEMRVDLKLMKEIRADHEFWVQDALYRMEVIVGDTRMPKGGVTWVAIRELRFNSNGRGSRSASVFEKGKISRGVFEFDVSVKKGVQPEFSSPIPDGARQAPRAAVAVALVAVAAPLPLVVVAWARLGALPLSLPEGGAEWISAIGFETCLLGHMVALVMFWLQWNIVQTWQAMAVLMVPTLYFGHRALSSLASRHVRLTSHAPKKNS